MWWGAFGAWENWRAQHSTFAHSGDNLIKQHWATAMCYALYMDATRRCCKQGECDLAPFARVRRAFIPFSFALLRQRPRTDCSKKEMERKGEICVRRQRASTACVQSLNASSRSVARKTPIHASASSSYDRLGPISTERHRLSLSSSVLRMPLRRV